MAATRRMIPLLALLTLVAGCTAPRTTHRPAAAGPAGAPTPTTPSPTACPPAGVTLALGGGDAAMGLRVLGIFLHNCGKRPIRLDGYPDVRLLDADRAPIAATALHGARPITILDPYDRPPRPVTVPPGGWAASGIVWRNLTTVAETIATGEYIVVSPAPGQPEQTLREPHIDLGNTGRYGVAPWAATDWAPSASPTPDRADVEPIGTPPATDRPLP